MTQAKLAIFDDGRGAWGPLTERRPVFALRSGAVTTRQRIERALRRADALFVSDVLAGVMREREPSVQINPDLNDDDWLLINGRWNGVADAAHLAALPRGEVIAQADGQLVAAHLDAQAARQVVASDFQAPPADAPPQRLTHDVLLDRPWHLLDELEAMLAADLEASDLPDARDDRPVGMQVAGDHALRIAPSAQVMPSVVANVEQGPVVIDHEARLDPFVALEGPCYIGAGAHVAAHTAIRAGTSVGAHCKVGGELKRAILHAHSNKAHLGYLGDAIVGEWCNLGANTNVSNIKNTYSTVRVQLDAQHPPEDTQRMRQGPIVGDFVRTAIGTRLLTGSVIGVGCMIAVSDFAPKHVSPLTFCTDQGVRAHELDALLTTAQRMMKLQDVELTDAEAALLRHLHHQANARLA